MFKKEQIKDRMLKTAARLWEIPEGEIETNFDPLIMLILEACAGELESIGTTISTTQSRLIDQLAEFILPQAMINAQPASCVIQAMPVEPYAELHENIRFYTTQRLQKTGMSAYNRDFYFTPIGHFPLLKAEISFMQCGSKFYRLQSSGRREIIFDTGSSGLSNEIYLAIAPDKALKHLQGLQLFFDLKGHNEASVFYNSLHHAHVWVNEQPITWAPGYYKGDQFDLNLQDVLGSGNNYSRKIHRQVAGIYQNRFLHFPGEVSADTMDIIPQSWAILPEKIQEEIAGVPLIFIRIEPGRHFHQETLDRLSCSINAFPAINRALNNMHFKTDTRINIVPMQIDGDFLDLQSVSGTSGKSYKIRTSADEIYLEEGEAILRSSGVGKTNSRDVRSIISNLTEAIRDESAYFSRISNEFVLSRLREISRILTRLEDQMALASDKKNALHYLLLRPKVTSESVAINYWTTYGPEAHNVKSGTPLNAFNHTLTMTKSAYLLTNPVGGKSVITESEKKYILQRQLSSGGKIISMEDVRLLSFQILGNKLKKIEIKKGVHPGAGRIQGFSNTIDVYLTLAAEAVGEDTDYLCRELEYNLNENASPVCTFRVMVVSQN